MTEVDVAILGGGPAGYTAALTAAEQGATVAIVESERPGGACVFHACIPTNVLLSATQTALAARELDAVGVLRAGETIAFGPLADRREALVRQVAQGIEAALAARKVQLLRARGGLAGPGRLAQLGDAPNELRAESIVIATGSRWERPALPGVADERVLTPDQVQRLRVPPDSALVLGDGPAETGFALEYAFLLAAAGSAVTLALPRPRLLMGLDAALDEIAAATLADAGVTVLYGAELTGGEGNALQIRHRDGTSMVSAEVVVAADPRRPSTDGLGLETAGIAGTGTLAVDAGCRAAAPSLFAAGDVTGGPMLTAAALEQGRTAGLNATGGAATARLRALPQVLHLSPAIGWVGANEATARAAGYDVCVGTVDLGFNPRAITQGGRP
ncbi:MAG TPA: NAD(P)/FAD-dependent oxidoreductase, partial [Dehalococcoidia bacterium]|nr:NAD(P)/FAD-dependent oxidoreductase [Dehalococcoidia bacterium]